MNENITLVRRQQVERLNGYWPTWWHYTRVTLALALAVVATALWAVNGARDEASLALAREDLMARATRQQLSCFVHDRPTSFIIAGGSQAQVYDALHDAELQLALVKLALLTASPNGRREMK